MTDAEAVAAPKKVPRVASLTFSDIVKSIREGLRDMQRAPMPSLAFGLAYAAFGWLILFLMFKLQWGVYAYPLATGFALVAPMAAAGLYDISRRLERGDPVTWGGVASCLFGRNGQAVRIMAVVTTFSYIIWLDIAAATYVMFFGMKSMTFPKLLEAVVTTWYGFVFLIVGNAIGAALALVVFSVMAVSLPIIFDREVDFVTAMITSVKCVIANPVPMLLWCLIIGFLLFLSLASMFAGLVVVFPLLGHATWHLYRRAVLADGAD